jgi:hypothetical protein
MFLCAQTVVFKMRGRSTQSRAATPTEPAILATGEFLSKQSPTNPQGHVGLVPLKNALPQRQNLANGKP